MASSRSLGSLTLDLVLKMGGFQEGMDKAARKVEQTADRIAKFGAGIGNALKAVAAFAIGSATVSTALQQISQSIDFADSLDELSARFNISTEVLSGWGYAAKLTGSDLDSLAGVIPKFSKLVADSADASSTAGKTFAALGIAVKDQNGNLRSFQDLLPEVADRFKGITNETTKTALAVQLFGKSGSEFLEFLSLGSDGLKDMADKAADLGVVIDGDTAAAAAKFKDELDNLRAATQGFFTVVSAELLPTLTSLTETMTDLAKNSDGARRVADTLSSALDIVTGAAQLLNSAITVAVSNIFALQKTGEAAAQGLTGNFKDARQSILSALSAFGTGMQSLQSIPTTVGGVVDGTIRNKPPKVQLIEVTDDDLRAIRRQEELEKQAKEAQDRLNKLWATGSGASKSTDADARRAAKAIDEMTKAQRQWQTELDGTGNKIVDEYASRLDEITDKSEKFATAGVPTDKITAFREQMTQLAEAIKSKDLADFQTEFDAQTQQIAGSIDGVVSPALLKYQSDLRELDKTLKSGAITQDEYNERLKALGDERNSASINMRKDLEFEMELLGKTREEQELLNAARRLGVDAATDQGKAAIQALQDYQAAAKEVDQQIQLMDGFRDTFADFFTDVLDGTKSVKDAFKDMLADISAQIARRIAENWVDQLLGQSGSTAGGASGGWLSAFAGLFSGGRAAGGAVNPGMMYRVNENRPELLSIGGNDYLMMGKQGGRVSQAGTGLTQVNNFYTQGRLDYRTQQQQAAEAGRRAQMASNRGIG